MSINGKKKLLRHLEKRLPYAIDITEYLMMKKRIYELREQIVIADKDMR